VGYEPTSPVFERAKTIHALGLVAIVIGYDVLLPNAIMPFFINSSSEARIQIMEKKCNYVHTWHARFNTFSLRTKNTLKCFDKYYPYIAKYQHKYSEIYNLCSSLRLTDRFSGPYETMTWLGKQTRRWQFLYLSFSRCHHWSSGLAQRYCSRLAFWRF
jgi:hypothetical protein